MKFINKKINSDQKSPIKPPLHLAIIMDGNYRWAKSKNLPTKFGHSKGTKNIENISNISIDLGIKYLSLYAFSTENWQRPKKEVDYLMNLLDEYLEKDINSLIEKDVKIIVSGDLTKLKESTQDKILEIEERTINAKSLTLNVAFSYGSRQEILYLVKNIANLAKNSQIKIEDIDLDLIKRNLYQNIPDPDLLIRTGGDLRVSNFLLYQIAYTELYFTEKYWPDFSKQDLEESIIEYNKRIRKYGKRQ